MGDDPFYLQDKAESSQDFKPLSFLSLCFKANLNLSIQTQVFCPASMLLLIYQVCYLYFPLFDVFIVVSVC